MSPSTPDQDTLVRQAAARQANWDWFKESIRQLMQEHPNEAVAVFRPGETLFFPDVEAAEQAVEERGLKWEAVVWFLRTGVEIR